MNDIYLRATTFRKFEQTHPLNHYHVSVITHSAKTMFQMLFYGTKQYSSLRLHKICLVYTYFILYIQHIFIIGSSCR